MKNNPVGFTIDQVWVIIDGAGGQRDTEKDPRGNSTKIRKIRPSLGKPTENQTAQTRATGWDKPQLEAPCLYLKGNLFCRRVSWSWCESKFPEPRYLPNTFCIILPNSSFLPMV